MTVDFCDYFWGEKNSGFDVLYQNSKYGQSASKEFAEFVKERAMVEENYSKMLGKLAHKAASAGGGGTFGPLWLLLRASTEKAASVHLGTMTRLTELAREVQKYADELHKRQKTLKEEEAPTAEAVQSLQQLTAGVLKCRDVYQQRAAELRRALEASPAGHRDLEKAEAKFRKAAEEYRTAVDKYNTVRSDFERKMIVSCRHFQELEEIYLCQMREYLDSYLTVLDEGQRRGAELDAELRQLCDAKPVLSLLEEFALSKHTGLEKPAVLQFEEVPVPGGAAAASSPTAAPDSAADSAEEVRTNSALPTLTLGRQGFLKRARREKQAKKRSHEQEEASAGEESHKTSPVIDEEGYSVIPNPESSKKKYRDSFYSSSDSDEEEDPTSRIHVKINPLSNGGPMSASVDELRHLARGLTLSPLTVSQQEHHQQEQQQQQQLRRSQSVSQQLGGPDQAPAPSPARSAPPPDTYTQLTDLFSETSDLPPELPPKHQPGRPAAPIALPRPPSRRSAERGSRGPSPLTLGLSETVPLAVAFQEVVHTYFRGSDPARCQVKITGDTMVSFPAGIVQVLSNNPSPAPLMFRLKHTGKLDSLLPNRQLISAEPRLSGPNTAVFSFRMDSLSALLRRQAQANPAASYFNLDILKYQLAPLAGAGSAPLHLLAFWKCEPTHTDLKVEYRQAGPAAPLLNLTVAVPVDGGVVTMHSKPSGRWVPASGRALWSLPEVAAGAEGALRARFDLSRGPGSPGTLAAQFSCEGSTLSGADFQLLGAGYRLSLVKRRVVSGKYLCDSDYIESSERYAAPPGHG